MHRIDAEKKNAGIPEETTHNHVDDYESGPGCRKQAYPEMRADKYSVYQDKNQFEREGEENFN